MKVNDARNEFNKLLPEIQKNIIDDYENSELKVSEILTKYNLKMNAGLLRFCFPLSLSFFKCPLCDHKVKKIYHAKGDIKLRCLKCGHVLNPDKPCKCKFCKKLSKEPNLIVVEPETEKKELSLGILTATQQNALILDERDFYKTEKSHSAVEYIKLNALNKSVHSKEELQDLFLDLRFKSQRRIRAMEDERTPNFTSSFGEFSDLSRLYINNRSPAESIPFCLLSLEQKIFLLALLSKACFEPDELYVNPFFDLNSLTFSFDYTLEIFKSLFDKQVLFLVPDGKYFKLKLNLKDVKKAEDLADYFNLSWFNRLSDKHLQKKMLQLWVKMNSLSGLKYLENNIFYALHEQPKYCLNFSNDVSRIFRALLSDFTPNQIFHLLKRIVNNTTNYINDKNISDKKHIKNLFLSNFRRCSEKILNGDWKMLNYKSEIINDRSQFSKIFWLKLLNVKKDDVYNLGYKDVEGIFKSSNYF